MENVAKVTRLHVDKMTTEAMEHILDLRTKGYTTCLAGEGDYEEPYYFFSTQPLGALRYDDYTSILNTCKELEIGESWQVKLPSGLTVEVELHTW